MLTSATQDQKGDPPVYLLRHKIGIGMHLCAVAAACALVLGRGVSIPIHMPAVLIAGALFVIIPAASASIIMLQRVMCLYLISMMIGQTVQEYATFHVFSTSVNLSLSMPVFAAILLGCLLGMGTPVADTAVNETARLRRAWGLALAVLLLHMGLLAWLLNKFYGYGTEEDSLVLGNLGLCFAITVVLWRPLGERIVRQCVGSLFTLSFGIQAWMGNG